MVALHLERGSAPSNDRGSLLHSAKFLGLDVEAAYQFGFPVEMFAEIIWPSLVPILSKWSAFYDRSGTLLLTPYATIDELEGLLRSIAVERRSAMSTREADGASLRTAGVMGYGRSNNIPGHYENRLGNLIEVERDGEGAHLTLGRYHQLQSIARAPET